VRLCYRVGPPRLILQQISGAESNPNPFRLENLLSAAVDNARRLLFEYFKVINNCFCWHLAILYEYELTEASLKPKFTTAKFSNSHTDNYLKYLKTHHSPKRTIRIHIPFLIPSAIPKTTQLTSSIRCNSTTFTTKQYISNIYFIYIEIKIYTHTTSTLSPVNPQNEPYNSHSNLLKELLFV